VFSGQSISILLLRFLNFETLKMVVQDLTPTLRKMIVNVQWNLFCIACKLKEIRKDGQGYFQN